MTPLSGAWVPDAKVKEYLLNPEHRRGASKSRFFHGYGFSRERWERLSTALTEHGRIRHLVKVVPTEFGPRYIVECSVETPDGRAPCIRTVWQAESAGATPHLITAYPIE